MGHTQEEAGVYVQIEQSEFDVENSFIGSRGLKLWALKAEAYLEGQLLCFPPLLHLTPPQGTLHLAGAKIATFSAVDFWLPLIQCWQATHTATQTNSQWE